MKQSSEHILMIEPIAFRFNEETAVNNYYQKHLSSITEAEVQIRALGEFRSFVSLLEEHGVSVYVFRDTTETDTPDSIFPNNWVSFHRDGRVGLYPMCAKNRRSERRKDIVESLAQQHHFEVKSIEDFTYLEEQGVFLEGTGSMILDRVHKICYAALSIRTEREAVLKFCEVFGYTPVMFTANQTFQGKRLPIYHTNVMMCVADEYAIICMDAVDSDEERKILMDSFDKTNKEVIEISEEQKKRFAGNMLQVRGKDRYLVMSTSAYNSLNKDQIDRIERYNSIVHSSLDTIEACGGGSARCMMAEVFLTKSS